MRLTSSSAASPAGAVLVQANGAQRRHADGSQLRVVDADDSHVVRDATAGLPASEKSADRQQVIIGKYRIGKWPICQQRRCR